MAMDLGGRKGIVAEMNVTPMIDILLVLIIVFMIINTATTATGLEALIPQNPTKTTDAPSPRTVIVQLLENHGEQALLRINQEPVTWEALRGRLIDIYKIRAERVLFVKADRSLEFEQVAAVIDTAHGAFRDIRIGLIP
jgi:biopolymer transport protein ExbD